MDIMKKLRFLPVAVIALLFVSCNNAKDTASQESTEDDTSVETVNSSAETETSSDETGTIPVENTVNVVDEIPVENTVDAVDNVMDLVDATATPVASDSNTDGEDWDALLDSYESFVDSYLAYIQKYKEGDVSAMTEYANALKEAQEYSEKISKVRSSLKPEQLKRYLKITEKMTKAM